jgi:D-alanyl-D-alanine carboxypeptidase (penicillin-binding protein 5/6)
MILHNKNKHLIVFLLILIVFCKYPAVAYSQTPDIISQSAILMDAGTGTVLFEKNTHEKLEPASITKIMTLLLALELMDSGKIKMADIIKISERAWKTGGSQVYLGPNEEQTLETLLKCITISSANDASVAVAEHIGGSVEGFAKMMNDKAKSLGMNDTNFVNPHGLSDANHYTSAYDVAIMAKELAKYDNFFTWSTVWIDYLEHTDKKREATLLANTNKLLGKYEGLDGMKTGFHSKAGHCFAGTAKRGSFRLISVIMNAENSKQRFEDTIKLFDYGFGQYDSVLVVKKDSINGTVHVEKGTENKIDAVAFEDYSILTKKGEEENITTRIELPEKLSAPLNKNQLIGNIVVEQNGNILKKIDLIATKEIKRAGIIHLFKKVLNQWFDF